VPTPNLTTAQWHLATLNHAPAVPADAANRPWLQFNDKAKTFQGSGGCNSISGPYTRSAALMHFGRMISTARACTDAAVNQQEQAFKFALQNVDRYEVRADTLVLSVGADAVAYLSR
jgi:heat shock protein HslJ